MIATLDDSVAGRMGVSDTEADSGRRLPPSIAAHYRDLPPSLGRRVARAILARPGASPSIGGRDPCDASTRMRDGRR